MLLGKKLVLSLDPILSIVGLCKALMLGIAYCASIGGVGMLTGTGPNLIAAQAADDRYKFSINFVNWASFATPLSVLMTLITWVVLVFVFLRDSGMSYNYFSILVVVPRIET